MGEKEELLGTVALIKALSSDDPIAIENALKRLLNLHDPRFAALARTLARHNSSIAEAELSSIVSKNLSGVALKLWWNGERFLPALFCPSLKAALYVETLLRSVHGGALAVCPRCSTPFVQTRSNKHYCSIQCREAHRVARYRAKLKATLTVGKGKVRAPKASELEPSSRRKKK
jgi:hypothetical protein